MFQYNFNLKNTFLFLFLNLISNTIFCNINKSMCKLLLNMFGWICEHTRTNISECGYTGIVKVTFVANKMKEAR